MNPHILISSLDKNYYALHTSFLPSKRIETNIFLFIPLRISWPQNIFINPTYRTNYDLDQH